jgi:hypothetical protein
MRKTAYFTVFSIVALVVAAVVAAGGAKSKPSAEAPVPVAKDAAHQ